MASPVFEPFEGHKPAYFSFCIQSEVYFKIACDHINPINSLGFSPLEFLVGFLVNFKITQNRKVALTASGV